jgi:triacylglycerol lipase
MREWLHMEVIVMKGGLGRSEVAKVARLASVLLPVCLAAGCAVEGEAAETATQQSAFVSDSYTRTRYPIVLCHGMSGFRTLFGVLDYFNGVESELRRGGAQVYITQVPQFNSTEERGEALLAQLEDIAARSGHSKFNLIGHSHGGLDIRYVTAVRPDLVASVTTVGSPHKGADLASYLRSHVREGGFTEDVLAFFADSLGTVLGLLSGHTDPQDSIAALESLTIESMARFNAAYPAGVPAEPCGNGPSEQNGTRFYSWSGTGLVTSLLDPSDIPFGLTSLVYSDANDGLVSRCSSHLGEVIRDNYYMNHLDEVNQLFGFIAFFGTNPKSLYRSHANRLKIAGL